MTGIVCRRQGHTYRRGEGVNDWAIFFLSASAIVIAGSFLARYADVIAWHTGWGRVWIGAILMATVTSLPELVTDVSAVRIEAIDLAVGDLFGSSMANMTILVAIALLFRRRRGRVGLVISHASTAGIAIALTSLAVMFLLSDNNLAIGTVGIGTIAILLLYVSAMWQLNRPAVTRGLATEVLEEEEETLAQTVAVSFRSALVGFVIAAAVIAVAGPFLAISADGVAAAIGVADSFFGALGVAVATSLPELSSSVSAARIRAMDLAYSNLFGSNAANMAMLFLIDIAYTDGSLLADIVPANALTATTAVLLTVLGVGLVLLQSRRQGREVVILGTVMLTLYVAGLLLIHQQSL